MSFEAGMTVRDLKELIKKWPEKDVNGEMTEVWMETGWCVSSPVISASALNLRRDDKTGRELSDLILKSGVFRK